MLLPKDLRGINYVSDLYTDYHETNRLKADFTTIGSLRIDDEIFIDLLSSGSLYTNEIITQFIDSTGSSFDNSYIKNLYAMNSYFETSSSLYSHSTYANIQSLTLSNLNLSSLTLTNLKATNISTNFLYSTINSSGNIYSLGINSNTILCSDANVNYIVNKQITSNSIFTSNANIGTAIITTANVSNLTATNFLSTSSNVIVSSVNNLRFNNYINPVYFTNNNLAIRVDANTIKISPDDGWLRIGNVGEILRGWRGLQFQNLTEFYDQFASLFGWSTTDDILDLLDIPAWASPDIKFASLSVNTNQFEFGNGTGSFGLFPGYPPYPLNLKLPNDDCVLFCNNSKIDGDSTFTFNKTNQQAEIGKLQGDYLNYVSATISNLRNTHAFSLNAGSIGTLLVNNLTASNTTIDNLRTNDMTVGSLATAAISCTNISSLNLIVSNNSSINNLKGTEFTVDYIEGDNLFYTNSTITNLKGTEFDVDYIEGNNLFYTNSTQTNIKADSITAGSLVAGSGSITSITTSSLVVGSLGTIPTLVSNRISTLSLTTVSLDANNSTLVNLTCTVNGSFNNCYTNRATFENAYFQNSTTVNLMCNTFSTFNSLYGIYSTQNNLVSANSSIGNISASNINTVDLTSTNLKTITASANSIRISDTSPSVNNEVISKGYLTDLNNWMSSQLGSNMILTLPDGKLKCDLSAGTGITIVDDKNISVNAASYSSWNSASTSIGARLAFLNTTPIPNGLLVGATQWDLFLEVQCALGIANAATALGVGSDALVKVNDILAGSTDLNCPKFTTYEATMGSLTVNTLANIASATIDTTSISNLVFTSFTNSSLSTSISNIATSLASLTIPLPGDATFTNLVFTNFTNSSISTSISNIATSLSSLSFNVPLNATFSNVTSSSLTVYAQTTGVNLIHSKLATGNGDRNFSLVAESGTVGNNSDSVVCKLGLSYNTINNAFINFYRGGSVNGGYISFSTNDDSERMIINGSGNIGIRTNSPSVNLHVSGTSIITSLTTSNLNATNHVSTNTTLGGLYVYTTSDSLISMQCSSPNTSTFVFSSDAVSRYSDLYFNPNESMFFRQRAGGTYPIRFIVASTGNIGIGTSTPNCLLDVKGSSFFNAISTTSLLASTISSLGYSGPFNIRGGGTASSSGPHINVYHTNSTIPNFQILNWDVNNIAINFSSYFDSGWKSRSFWVPYQIYNYNDLFQINYVASATSFGGSITWSTGLQMNSQGNISCGNVAMTNISSSSIKNSGVINNGSSILTPTLHELKSQVNYSTIDGTLSESDINSGFINFNASTTNGSLLYLPVGANLYNYYPNATIGSSFKCCLRNAMGFVGNTSNGIILTSNTGCTLYTNSLQVLYPSNYRFITFHITGTTSYNAYISY